jgi:basic amino acid/polyamine antiporter, APA family
MGLSRLQLFMMSFGTIVGVGWIVVLGDWVAQAGPGGTVIALLLGAVAMWIVAGNYAVLARHERIADGGEAVAVTDTWGAGAGFTVTVALAVAYISIVAFEAVSAGWILITLLPVLEGPVLYQVKTADVNLGLLVIALLGGVIVALLNARALQLTARVQDGLVWLLLLITLLFCCAGVSRGDVQHWQPWFSGGGIAALVATMPLWYAGFNVVPQLFAERDPKVSLQMLGPIMYVSIAAAAGFYVAVVLATTFLVPWQSLVALPLPVATAFGQAFDNVFWRNLTLLAGLLGILSTWNACFAAAVRVLQRLVSQLQRPAWSLRFAVLWVALLSSLMALNGRAALIPIVNVGACCFGVVYLFICLSAWRVATRAWERFLAFSGIAVSVFMSGYVMKSALDNSATAIPTEWLIAAVTIAIAAVIWKARIRKLKHAS